jgi:rubrerythrin
VDFVKRHGASLSDRSTNHGDGYYRENVGTIVGLMSLHGTTTEANLRLAFARECEANHRYLFFAQKADIEGHPEVAALFRNIADGETGHAHGHLEYLAALGAGDPATAMAIGSTEENLASAIASEAFDYAEMYPGFAQAARDEGFNEIADWFAALARAETTHAGRFELSLDGLPK